MLSFVNQGQGSLEQAVRVVLEVIGGDVTIVIRPGAAACTVEARPEGR